MPIYTNDPFSDGAIPCGVPLVSSIGINPKVTKAIDAATRDWLDDHPEATTTVEDDSITSIKLKNGSVTPDKLSDDSIDAMPTMSPFVRGVAKVGAGLAMNGDSLELDGSGDIATAVASWLDAHPEATTTVQPNTITDDMLVQTGGVLSRLGSILYESVNAFDNTTVVDGIYINASGAEVVNANSHTTDFFPVVGGAPYIRSFIGSATIYIAFYDSNKAFVSRVQAWYSPTGTVPSTASYARLSAYNTTFPDDFMFVFGESLPSAYVPHYTINNMAIRSIIDDTLTIQGKAADSKVVGDKLGDIVVGSANLYNKATDTSGYYIHSNGTLVAQAASNVSDYIEVESETAYACTTASNLYYAEYDENKTFIQRSSLAAQFTTGSTTRYIRLSAYNTAFPAQMMLVQGTTTPTEYVGYKQINPDLLPQDDTTGVLVTKVSSTQLSIQTGKGRHVLTHQTIANKNLDTWRLTQGYAANKLLWNDVDVEGPIKEKNVTDFMTGYHGDEVMTDVVFIVDGTPTTIENIVDGEYGSLVVMVTSDVYYDGDTTNKAFVRHKRLVFEGNKVRIYNTYEFIGTTPIEIDIATGTGLYPVSSNYVNGYATNVGNAYVSEATTGRNTKIDSVSFFGDGFTMNIGVIFGKGDNYSGVVYYYPEQTRYKVYFYQQYANASNYLTMSNGDKLLSGYEIEFV